MDREQEGTGVVIKIGKRKVTKRERENLRVGKGERSDVLRTCGPPAPRSILLVSKSRYERSTGTLRAATNSRTSDSRSMVLKNFQPRETKETLLFTMALLFLSVADYGFIAACFFHFPPRPPVLSASQFVFPPGALWFLPYLPLSISVEEFWPFYYFHSSIQDKCIELFVLINSHCCYVFRKSYNLKNTYMQNLLVNY